MFGWAKLRQMGAAVAGHKGRIMQVLRRGSAVALAVTAIFVLCCVRWIRADTEVPTISIHARCYEFSPSEITLKKGEAVKLVFVADDVSHGIAIPDLGLKADLPKHRAQAFSITPARSGDFDGECSRYCGSGHSDMTFVVHVRP
jgi:cytochrome c oxidase subunit II